MATPNQEAIDTFVSITGAIEAVAVQKLEAHGGDLNEAVNAHFSEGDPSRSANVPKTAVAAPQYDFMGATLHDGEDNHILGDGSHRKNIRPNSPEFHWSLDYNDDIEEEMILAAIEASKREVEGGHNNLAELEPWPRQSHLEDAILTHAVSGSRGANIRPNASAEFNRALDYSDDIEEEMILAAIEASKREVEGVHNDLAELEPLPRQSHLENAELAHAFSAVSMSQQTAEKGKRESVGASDVGASKPAEGEQVN